MLKQLGIKLIVLFTILCGLNFLYTITLFKSELQNKCPEVIELRNSQTSTDVYYFGESSNITYSPDDSIKSSISELTSKFYPDLAITNINKYATHAGIFKHWLYQLTPSKKLPKAIVVTLNLRSFGAAWRHSKLETALQESLVLMQNRPNLLNRFLLSLQAFDNKSETEREKDMKEEWAEIALQFPYKFRYRTVSKWDSTMAYGGHLKPDGSWDMPKIELACHFVKAYAFNLSKDNARIKDFDDIADWCSKNKISLYLNLMAENIQYADSLAGNDLSFLMKQNRDFLVNRYHSENCTVVDNLEAVNGKQFIDQNWTTEHYNCKGRMTIAKNLATALKKQFNTNYKEAY